VEGSEQGGDGRFAEGDDESLPCRAVEGRGEGSGRIGLGFERTYNDVIILPRTKSRKK
jgi:hypothetical protein